jgi:16S rRNA (cytidine1402-2'-O)-methyltransferase
VSGRLFLVPNRLGDVAPDAVLPARTIAVARGLAHYVVENAKPARQFLKALETTRPLQEIAVVELPGNATAAQCRELLAPARAGHDMGLLSDAGCPAVADPGARLVAAAHADGIPVVPLVGPSSLLLALMASGMNGQGFTFHGYLPVKAEARDAALRRIEADSARTGYAQLFIETPYRTAAMLAAACATCKPATRLALAADLTLPTERNASRTIAAWRGDDPAPWADRPALFLLQA